MEEVEKLRQEMNEYKKSQCVIIDGIVQSQKDMADYISEQDQTIVQLKNEVTELKKLK